MSKSRKIVCTLGIENLSNYAFSVSNVLVKSRALVPIFDEETLRSVCRLHRNNRLRISAGLPQQYLHLLGLTDQNKNEQITVKNEPVQQPDVSVTTQEKEEVLVDKLSEVSIATIEQEFEVLKYVAEEELEKEVSESAALVDVDSMTKEEISSYASENNLDIIVGKRTSVETARQRLKESLGYTDIVE
jgi:hypothetical protein